MADPVKMEVFVDSVRVMLQQYGTAWLKHEQFLDTLRVSNESAQQAKDRVAMQRKLGDQSNDRT